MMYYSTNFLEFGSPESTSNAADHAPTLGDPVVFSYPNAHADA
jgi:hypothetical protein